MFGIVKNDLIEKKSDPPLSILKPNNHNNSEGFVKHPQKTETNNYEDEQEENNVSLTNDLNELCLKTPNQKLVTTGEKTKSVQNKVTFDPPPGTFNITFDTSESESESEEINLNAKVEAVKTTPKKLLEGVTVFVDVRAENENRSKAISRELERLGATIADKITNHTTHIVYKDGRQGTLTQLKKYQNIHFVSVLWVDACKTIGCRVNEDLYPARKPNEDMTGLPPARVKRVKSLQPKTFEEDVNNSAKKEDRRRKRLKKLDKNYDTPTDQIICLDSQEYIKSSDLHKLVATPLAIPDTPWILHYINGSDSDNNETSPDKICSKLDLNDSRDEVKTLSQEVQCKLNFDTSPKRSSCLIDIGSSPSKGIQPKHQTNKHENDNDKKDIVEPTPKKVYFARRSSKLSYSTCRRPSTIDEKNKPKSPKTGSSITKPISQMPGKQKAYLNLQKSNTISLSSDPILRSQSNFSPLPNDFKNKSASQNTRTSPISLNVSRDIVKPTSPVISPLLQTFFNLSPVKDDQRSIAKILSSPEPSSLIDTESRLASSPLKRKSPSKISFLKKDAELKVDLNEIGKPQVSKKKKKLMSKNIFSVPQDKLISPALKNDTSQIKVDKKVEEANKKKRQQPVVVNKNERPNAYTMLQQLGQSRKGSFGMTTKDKKKEAKKVEQDANQKEITNAYLSLMEENMEDESKKHSDRQNNKKNEDVDRKYPPQTNLVCVKKDPEVKADQNYAEQTQRRSTRISLRRSSIDFQIGKRFVKTKPKEDFDKCAEIQSSPLPKEFSLTDNGPIGLNVSFVHDEKEGLVCTSQNNGTVYLVTEDEDSDVGLLDEGPLANGEIDSGISDSEEVINDNEVNEEKKKENKMVQETTASSTITTVRQLDKNRSRNISIHSTSTDNKTINKSNSMKKCKQSLVCTSLHFSEQDFAKGVVKQLKDFQLKKNIAPDTTHVIAGSGRRTLNILNAIVQGCWILNPQWLSDSFEANCWLNEEDYEMYKEFPAAKVSRLNRMRHGRSSSSRLFSKIPRIFLAEVTSPPHEEMMRLIVSCGGKLTNAIRKAGIAIGLVTCRRKDIKILSEKWILDSITNGYLMPTKTYEYLLRCAPRESSPDY